MRPRYMVLPYDAGGYGVWRDIAGEVRKMVSYKVSLKEAERCAEKLNAEVLGAGNARTP